MAGVVRVVRLVAAAGRRLRAGEVRPQGIDVLTDRRGTVDTNHSRLAGQHEMPRDEFPQAGFSDARTTGTKPSPDNAEHGEIIIYLEVYWCVFDIFGFLLQKRACGAVR